MKKNKRLLFATAAASLALAATSSASTVVYQDTFDNDTLATNTGTGGGGANNTLDSGQEWLDNGNLSLDVTNGNFANSAFFYTTNAFQSSNGFQLDVDYTYSGVTTASEKFGIGLISNDTNLADLTGAQSLFGTADTNDTFYSLGVNMVANAGSGTVGLNFSNGTSSSNLDENTTATFQEATNLFLQIGPGGAWSYSLDGVVQASGTIAGGFDLTKSYHVVVFSQDDQSAKQVQSITLSTIPEPSSYGLLAGLSGLVLVMLRRRRD